MNLYISSASQFLQQFWKDKRVRIVEKDYKLGQYKFINYDISLNSVGKDEDEEYIGCEDYRINIRRGNTIIQILHKNKKIQTLWGRKGTPKIFDIKLEFIDEGFKKGLLNEMDQKYFSAIFSRVLKAFELKSRVEIVKTEKANGQNAQVSYCYQLHAWVICSKNVSIVAEFRKDLNYYQGQRYTYALQIAREWFNLTQKLDKQMYADLKKTLDGYTIIGQYCGNPKYQHLIKYKQCQLRWFAMVKNDSSQYCQDPFSVRDRLKKYQFCFVKLKSMAICNNKISFFKELQTLYLKTAKASINDIEYGMEGSIVYFIEHYEDKRQIQLEVIGAGKLKTVQYRFFRKIREKLSSYNNKKATQSEQIVVNNYQNECKKLMKDNATSAPFPLSYYTKILRKGLQFVLKYGLSDQQLRGNFITLLDLIFYTIYRKVELTKDLYKNQDLKNKIRQIEWSDYQGNGCNTFVIYIPIGLPGLGKSYLFKKMQNHLIRLNYKYRIISSDKIRREAMDELKKTNKQATEQQAFDKTGSKASGWFKQQLIDTLDKGFDKYDKAHYFIYLDKNHTSEAIESTLKILNTHTPSDCNFKVVYIVPKVNENFSIGDITFPFSIEQIASCILTSLQRKQHFVLDCGNLQNVGVVGFFLNLYSNFEISGLSEGTTKEYEFPYLKTKSIKNLEKISAAIEDLVKNCKQQPSKDLNLLKQVYKTIESNFDFEFTSQEIVQNEIEELISLAFPKIPNLLKK